MQYGYACRLSTLQYNNLAQGIPTRNTKLCKQARSHRPSWRYLADSQGNPQGTTFHCTTSIRMPASVRRPLLRLVRIIAKSPQANVIPLRRPTQQALILYWTPSFEGKSGSTTVWSLGDLGNHQPLGCPADGVINRDFKRCSAAIHYTVWEWTATSGPDTELHVSDEILQVFGMKMSFFKAFPKLSIFLSFCRLRFVFMLSLELCRCSSDLFLSSRPRTGLATTYITGYGWGPIG